MRPISRRLFLAGSAAVVVTACSGGSDASSPSSPDGADDTAPANPPVTEAPGTTATPTTTEPVVTPAEAPPLDVTADPFTLGVASGDPSVGGVVLWTRLAPDPLAGGGMPDADVDVAWDIARDDTFTDLWASGTVTALATHGHSIHLQAEMQPGWWYYRFRVGEWTSPVGRTQPAPAMTAEPTQVRFASASCQNYQDGFYTAHADIAAQQPDFVAFLGDYIYESGPYPVGENGVVRSHDGPEPTDLIAYRNRYALYRSDPQLQAAHAACPWFVIWDDHEVENNYAALVPQDPADADGFAERRQQAYQAWWEHQPVALPPPPEQGEFRMYRAARWGSLLDIALLDGRQYRSDQACGDVSLNVAPPCPETFDPARTMIGDEQEQWLLDQLGGHTAAWSVIAQQTVFGNTTLGGAVLNYDQWDGYPADRSRIVDALDPARNTIVLTGDIHFAGVGTIRQGERVTGTAVGVEFVATSISSGGNVDPAITDVVKAIPDILDVELAHRGYILHTVTPEAWSAEYRMVETVKEPDAAMFVHATYRVTAGENTAAFV
jgi:alkaline phosphatase D